MRTFLLAVLAVALVTAPALAGLNINVNSPPVVAAPAPVVTGYLTQSVAVPSVSWQCYDYQVPVATSYQVPMATSYVGYTIGHWGLGTRIFGGPVGRDFDNDGKVGLRERRLARLLNREYEENGVLPVVGGWSFPAHVLPAVVPTAPAPPPVPTPAPPPGPVEGTD